MFYLEFIVVKCPGLSFSTKHPRLFPTSSEDEFSPAVNIGAGAVASTGTTGVGIGGARLSSPRGVGGSELSLSFGEDDLVA